MAPNDAGDARLIEECAAFQGAFARYIHGCAAFTELEAEAVELSGSSEVDDWTSVPWQESLCRVSQIPADTRPGILAKGGVLRTYLAERPADDPCGTALVLSILTDLALLLN